MAEQRLYDAAGHPIVFADPAGAAPATWATPTPLPPTASRTTVTRPAGVREVPPAARTAEPERQEVVTTSSVQAAAEYADQGTSEVIGGQIHIPFGPSIAIEQDDAGRDVDPGFAYAWTEQGARRTFRIAESIGLMPLLRFAHAAKAGMDTDDLEGMAALYTMIQDVVDPADWPAFVEYATDCKAEDEELMEFVGSAMEVITARPRKRRGNSSDTSPSTSARSRGYSSGQATPFTPQGPHTPAEVDGLMPVADLTR